MLRRLPIYLRQNVLALLALFVALGGTAYAVNTVNSSDIVDGQVKSVDVGDGEIGSADVKDGSLNTFDVHSFLGVDVVDDRSPVRTFRTTRCSSTTSARSRSVRTRSSTTRCSSRTSGRAR